MISKEERERDRAICEAAAAGPWHVNRFDNEGGAINWQVQSRAKPYEVIANVDDSEVVKARATATMIARAREALPAYIADAEEMERRIAEVEALAAARTGVLRDEGAAIQAVLRILRGEP